MSQRYALHTSVIGKFTCHYSGGLSKRFWKHINSLPYPQRSQLYAMGCILQNVETAILRELAEVQGEVSMVSMVSMKKQKSKPSSKHVHSSKRS